jgi:glycosyltransferase involved in cell wall biosynthesis
MLRWLYWPWGGYPVLRDAHAVFFLCEEERQRARQPFWLYDCHEFVVRPGLQGLPPGEVDPGSAYFFEKHPSLRGKRLFTVVTADNPVENMGNLIEAVDLLSQKGVWDLKSMTLVVLVSAKPRAREYLESLAKRHGVSGSVEILGSDSERDSWGALQASEATVRTSPFEVSLREVVKALSCGKPVLASNGILYWKEIVNDGAGMAADATTEGYARMLGAWLRLDAKERAAMSSNARRCYEARFSHIGAAHSLTSAIYLLVGIHRDSRWDSRPLRPASESM